MALDRVVTGQRGIRTLILALLVAAALVSCGDGTASTDTTGPVTAGASSASTAVAAPSVTTVTTATTAAPVPTTAPTTARPSTTARRATVHDLERDLEDTIDDDGSYPGRATCEAEGPLADWRTVLCYYLPDEPGEFGGIHVSIFDNGRYAWALGECCGGGPWVDAYASGLFCRDLMKPPASGMERPEEYHLSYGLAVYYWVQEGRPDRMDADGNGVPCETVYPKSEVDKYWASVRVLS